MAIAATVIDVIEGDDPHLVLGPISKYDGPGQPKLYVVNRPCPPLAGLVGCKIWGGSTFIMCGQTQIAERTSYTSIRLLAPGEPPTV